LFILHGDAVLRLNLSKRIASQSSGGVRPAVLHRTISDVVFSRAEAPDGQTNMEAIAIKYYLIVNLSSSSLADKRLV
jgi:hypothetical protein